MEFRKSVVICLTVITLGGLLFSIGLFTKHWWSVVISPDWHIGLWELCGRSIETGRKVCGLLTSEDPYGYKSILIVIAWAMQAMMCLGLLSYIISIVLHLLLLFVRKVNVKKTQTFAWIFSSCAAIFIFIGLAIFGIKYTGLFGVPSAPGYSFYLTVTANILAVVNAILVAKIITPEKTLMPVVPGIQIGQGGNATATTTSPSTGSPVGDGPQSAQGGGTPASPENAHVLAQPYTPSNYVFSTYDPISSHISPMPSPYIHKTDTSPHPYPVTHPASHVQQQPHPMGHTSRGRMQPTRQPIVVYTLSK